PQMRPEKTAPRDRDEAFTAIGVPAEWVAPVRKAGAQTVAALAATASAGKLHQELCGINKKYKLELHAPSIDDVKAWIEAAVAATGTPDGDEA
ncbi:MAG: DUF4332 domain-containing protein, partial [Paramuribaculum sp.]|nr:DUF4332 domain-containing protein [Paramuribaculum sp.]